MFKYSKYLVCFMFFLSVSTTSCQIISPLQKLLKSQELVEEANSYYQVKNYLKAIELYTKAIELNPHSQTGFYNRGVCYSKIGDYVNSIKDYTKVIELEPNWYKGYTSRGVVYTKNGEFDLAIKDLNRADRKSVV